jgi:hypothetical protein
MKIRVCSGCGKQIITRRRTADGEIVSEYCDQAGRGCGCAQRQAVRQSNASRRGKLPVTFDEDQKLLTAQIAALNRPRETRLRPPQAEG